MEGFFADPLYGGNRDMVSWKMIGFPGARYDYREYIEANIIEPYPLPPVPFMSGASDWAGEGLTPWQSCFPANDVVIMGLGWTGSDPGAGTDAKRAWMVLAHRAWPLARRRDGFQHRLYGRWCAIAIRRDLFLQLGAGSHHHAQRSPARRRCRCATLAPSFPAPGWAAQGCTGTDFPGAIWRRTSRSRPRLPNAMAQRSSRA